MEVILTITSVLATALGAPHGGNATGSPIATPSVSRATATLWLTRAPVSNRATLTRPSTVRRRVGPTNVARPAPRGHVGLRLPREAGGRGPREGPRASTAKERGIQPPKANTPLARLLRGGIIPFPKGNVLRPSRLAVPLLARPRLGEGTLPTPPRAPARPAYASSRRSYRPSRPRDPRRKTYHRVAALLLRRWRVVG